MSVNFKPLRNLEPILHYLISNFIHIIARVLKLYLLDLPISSGLICHPPTFQGLECTLSCHGFELWLVGLCVHSPFVSAGQK